jgi:hypothetical protein
VEQVSPVNPHGVNLRKFLELPLLKALAVSPGFTLPAINQFIFGFQGLFPPRIATLMLSKSR